MFPSARRALVCAVLLLGTVASRSSPAELRSRISGVEELLEEFRKELQEDGDRCASGFSAAEQRIIRASASIERGAAFLSAPPRVFSWRDCAHSCCAHPHCTAAIIQERRQEDESLRCYLFNCTYRGANVCVFSFRPGFSTYSRVSNATGARAPSTPTSSSSSTSSPAHGGGAEESVMQGRDEPPRSDAGQDLVVQLPTDWAVLDGRDSADDHAITHYHWALVRGDAAVQMKVTHPGLLKLTALTEGVYTFELTVSDAAGQRSSDNVSVSVLAPNAGVCTGHCSRYQFTCDDGCCIDIGYACDGKQHCPDRSDEDFCQNFDGGRKSSQHGPDVEGDARMETPEPAQSNDFSDQSHCTAPPVVGPCKGVFPRWYYDAQTGTCLDFQYGGCKGNHNNFLQKSDCVKECVQKPDVPAGRKHQATAAPAPRASTRPTASVREESEKSSETQRGLAGHPPPESGAVLPLALGLLISALLLLMVGCRLWLVLRRIKRALPLTTEESDYLINGMYL